MTTLRRLSPALLILLLTSASATAQTAPCAPAPPSINERCPTWQAAYNHTGGITGLGPDIMRGAALSPDGSRIFVGGTSYDDARGYDAILISHATSDGTAAWAKRWSTRDFDTFSSLAVSPDGSLLAAAGRSGPNEDVRALTQVLRTDDGSEVWGHLYSGPSTGIDYAWATAFSRDGSVVYVGGARDDGSNDAHGDAILLGYDASDGTLLWEVAYAGFNKHFDVFLDLELSPDGSVLYAAGQSHSPGAQGDALLVAYDVSQEPPRELWVERYDGGSNVDRGVDVEVSSDGSRIALAAESRAAGATTNDWATLVLDASGEPIWSARYAGGNNGNDSPAGLVIAGDRVIVAGSSSELGTNSDVAVRAYSLADGTVLWTQPYSSPANHFDASTDIALSPDGRTVYVTGYSFYPRGELGPVFRLGNGAFLTMALDPDDGVRQWVARYSPSGRGEDVAQAVLPSPDGEEVYVSGTFVYAGSYLHLVPQTGPSSWDLGIVAYDA